MVRVDPRRVGPQMNQVYVALRELVARSQPGERLPTTTELCQLFMTSRGTLNEALKLLEAQNMLSRKQGSGIFVSEKLHRKYLCILLPARFFANANVSPFWGIFWGCLAKEAARRKQSKDEYVSFHLVLDDDAGSIHVPEDVQQMILDQKVHGMLIVGSNKATTDWLEERAIPYVTFAGYGNYSIGVDLHYQVQLAAARLAACGCQRPGLWLTREFERADEDPAAYTNYPSLFQTALAEHGMTFDPALVRSYARPAGRQPLLYQEQGYQLAMEIFGGPGPAHPDGLFLIDDMLTAGALVALQRLNIRVGRDVHIVTHANVDSPMLFGVSDSLILIENDPHELAFAMFEMLDTLLAGAQPATHTFLLKPKLRQ